MELLGIGLYSVPEASRLTGVAAARIRRWVSGYSYSYQNDARRSEPLWHSQVPEIEGKLGLGFRDLAEIRVVNALIEARFGLVTIRRAMALARDIVNDERPFSTSHFRTDGRTIFLQVVEESSEPMLLDLLRRQHAFHRIVEPTLKDLDFDKEVAIRWWPEHGRHDVVLDPLRSFGQPITSEGGVPTSVLADAVRSEGSVAKAALLYDVPKKVVRSALAFEERLAA